MITAAFPSLRTSLNLAKVQEADSLIEAESSAIKTQEINL